jgi:hypothetical protein
MAEFTLDIDKAWNSSKLKSQLSRDPRWKKSLAKKADFENLLYSLLEERHPYLRGFCTSRKLELLYFGPRKASPLHPFLQWWLNAPKRILNRCLRRN